MRNCTVVEGNVRIILITRANVTDEEYKPLPRLREITGSLLVFQVRKAGDGERKGKGKEGGPCR